MNQNRGSKEVQAICFLYLFFQSHMALNWYILLKFSVANNIMFYISEEKSMQSQVIHYLVSVLYMQQLSRPTGMSTHDTF